jgi:hypothetical protein
MQQRTVSDTRTRALEHLILLLLGAQNKKISMLHLEKEAFFLWNFHPDIKNFMKFISHYRGPYSEEIDQVIRNPFHLINCWHYSPPDPADKLTGGFVELTPLGRDEYERLYKASSANPQMNPILAAMKMVRELYDKLTPEELLLLIYDTYPEYREKSNVYYGIQKSKKRLAENLVRKGYIDNERYENLIASS